MAYGDVGSVLDTVTINGGSRAEEPAMLHVAGNIIAIAFEGADGDGWVKSFTIDPATQEITATGFSLEFDTTTAEEIEMLHVADDVYCVIHREAGGFGGLLEVKTFTIDQTTGEFSAVLDTATIITSDSKDPHAVRVGTTSGAIAFAVVFEDNNNDGRMRTFTIDESDGSITVNVDLWEFLNNSTIDMPRLFSVSGTTYVGTVGGTSTVMFTANITTAGDMTPESFLDSSSDIDFSNETDMLHVSEGSEIMVLVKEGGQIVTLALESDGTIGEAIATETLDTQVVSPSMAALGKGLFAVAYQGPGSDGWLKTFSVTASGAITMLGSREFNTSSCFKPRVILMPETSTLVVASHISGLTGQIKTMQVVLGQFWNLWIDDLNLRYFDETEEEEKHVKFEGEVKTF